PGNRSYSTPSEPRPVLAARRAHIARDRECANSFAFCQPKVQHGAACPEGYREPSAAQYGMPRGSSAKPVPSLMRGKSTTMMLPCHAHLASLLQAKQATAIGTGIKIRAHKGAG